MPIFDADKWLEHQNRCIAKEFMEIVGNLEALYKGDAERQVKAAQCKVLSDYNEFYRLKRENKSLWETSRELESEMNTLLESLAAPETRNIILAVSTYSAEERLFPFSSGGGGSTSNLAWDGRRPDEDDEAYRRRCFRATMEVIKIHIRSYRRK